MEINGKRIILRSWKNEDVEDLVEGLNNINVSKWLAAVPYPYTKKDAEEFIAYEKQSEQNASEIKLAIVLKENRLVLNGAGEYVFYVKATSIETTQGITAYREGGFEEGVQFSIEKISNKEKMKAILGNLYNVLKNVQYIYNIKFTKDGQDYEVTDTYIKFEKEENVKIHFLKDGVLHDITANVNNGEEFEFTQDLGLIVYDSTIQDISWVWIVVGVVSGIVAIIIGISVAVYVYKKRTPKIARDRDARR